MDVALKGASMHLPQPAIGKWSPPADEQVRLRHGVVARTSLDFASN
jgi:hypothetical protein